MPRPDPTPAPAANQRLWALTKFRRVMRWMALAAILAAAAAVALVAWGSEGVHIHMLIATALGAGLSVLLAGALMSLIFLSSASGHDDTAGKDRKKDAE